MPKTNLFRTGESESVIVIVFLHPHIRCKEFKCTSFIGKEDERHETRIDPKPCEKLYILMTMHKHVLFAFLDPTCSLVVPYISHSVFVLVSLPFILFSALSLDPF